MLDEKTKALIAVGAAVTANCQSCLEVRTGKALEAGATREDIRTSIEVAGQVRSGAAGKLDRFAAALIDGPATGQAARQGCC